MDSSSAIYLYLEVDNFRILLALLVPREVRLRQHQENLPQSDLSRDLGENTYVNFAVWHKKNYNIRWQATLKVLVSLIRSMYRLNRLTNSSRVVYINIKSLYLPSTGQQVGWLTWLIKAYRTGNCYTATVEARGEVIFY